MVTKKKTLPVVAQIINDLQIVDGHVMLGADKLVSWSKKLKKDHWGAEHRDVYLQLGGYALELAKKKAPAALELVALATLPDAAREAGKKSETSAFSADPGLQAKVTRALGSKTEARAPKESENPKPSSAPKPKRGLSKK
jgi:hypothetical protein